MNIATVATIAAASAQPRQAAYVQPQTEETSFEDVMNAATQAGGTRVFKDAPAFVVEWAYKYNVHISKTAVPLGKDGPYTPAGEGIPMLPTVHIHPKALERMENDPAFAAKMEKEIARLSAGMHRVQEEGVGGAKLAGTSITIHEDGSVTSKISVIEEKKGDTWAMTEELMKKVDQICEDMHTANVEKVKRQLEEILKNRASSEFRRIGGMVSADTGDVSAVPETSVPILDIGA